MERDELLNSIYYDAKKPGALGGVEALFREAKKTDPVITRDHVTNFLRRQRTYTLHKPYRKKFERNRTLVGSIDKQWQVDLADMTQLARANGGHRYLLTCIDCFSRFAWVVPVKRKTATDVEAAFRKLFAMANPKNHSASRPTRGRNSSTRKLKIFSK